MFTGQSRNCICDRDFSRTPLRSLSPHCHSSEGMGRMGWDGADPGKCGNDGGEARKRGSEEVGPSQSHCAAACGSSSLLSPCSLQAKKAVKPAY
jgi:hypothetical protein